jgi:hypothetical protein
MVDPLDGVIGAAPRLESAGHAGPVVQPDGWPLGSGEVAITPFAQGDEDRQQFLALAGSSGAA